MSLSVLDKLHNRKGVSAELVAFLYAESQKPTMLSPEYAEAYAHAALHADLQTVADVSASSLIHGEQSYSVDTPISVVMHESTAVVIVSGGLVSRHEMGLCGATASYEGFDCNNGYTHGRRQCEKHCLSIQIWRGHGEWYG